MDLPPAPPKQLTEEQRRQDDMYFAKRQMGNLAERLLQELPSRPQKPKSRPYRRERSGTPSRIKRPATFAGYNMSPIKNKKPPPAKPKPKPPPAAKPKPKPKPRAKSQPRPRKPAVDPMQGFDFKTERPQPKRRPIEQPMPPKVSQPEPKPYQFKMIPTDTDMDRLNEKNRRLQAQMDDDLKALERMRERDRSEKRPPSGLREGMGRDERLRQLSVRDKDVRDRSRMRSLSREPEDLPPIRRAPTPVRQPSPSPARQPSPSPARPPRVPSVPTIPETGDGVPYQFTQIPTDADMPGIRKNLKRLKEQADRDAEEYARRSRGRSKDDPPPVEYTRSRSIGRTVDVMKNIDRSPIPERIDEPFREPPARSSRRVPTRTDNRVPTRYQRPSPETGFHIDKPGRVRKLTPEEEERFGKSAYQQSIDAAKIASMGLQYSSDLFKGLAVGLGKAVTGAIAGIAQPFVNTKDRISTRDSQRLPVIAEMQNRDAIKRELSISRGESQRRQADRNRRLFNKMLPIAVQEQQKKQQQYEDFLRRQKQEKDRQRDASIQREVDIYSRNQQLRENRRRALSEQQRRKNIGVGYYAPTPIKRGKRSQSQPQPVLSVYASFLKARNGLGVAPGFMGCCCSANSRNFSFFDFSGEDLFCFLSKFLSSCEILP